MPTNAKSKNKPAIDHGLPDQSQTPTSISSWKKGPAIPKPTRAEGFIVDLPSENVVLMTRTMDMPILLKTGKIPNPLAGIVQRMIDTRNPEYPQEAMDTEVMMQLLDLMHETIVRCVLEPPFDMPAPRVRSGKDIETAEDYQQRLSEWTPDFTEDGEREHITLMDSDPEHEKSCECERKISVWDMYMDDRLYIFAVAQGAAADLASFRKEQERNVADLQAGERVRVPTKRTGGSRSKKSK